MTVQHLNDTGEARSRQVAAYSVLDNLIEGCQLIAPDWRYLYVNNALVRQGRRTREELIGRTMMECYPGIEATPMFTMLRRCMETRRPDRMENEFRFPDGSVGWFELRFEPMPEGVFILSLDCTDRRRAEEQLRQTQKMEAIGQLAGGVAHDFNNLLTVILIQAGRFLKELGPDDPARATVDAILKAGERAASLTGQLLAFSRQQVLELHVVDLNAVILETGDMLRRLIDENVTVRTVLQDDLGRVKADPNRIGQILINLAVNARDAMPQGGTLTFETRDVELDETYARTHLDVKPGPYVMLAVSDTGVGMTRETLSHVFEPFFTTKKPGGGTGLGLATVFGIVKQSGGTIWVYSEPGRGTTFKIYLPRLAEETDDGAERGPAHATPPGDETVLVVEDDDAVREITVSALEELGYRVLQAANGREAVALSEAHPAPVHLLVTDVVMPGMSGSQVAEVLQASRPGLKVLFLSGYTDDAMIRHGLMHQEIAFLQKPFTVDALARKIRETLAPPAS